MNWLRLSAFCVLHFAFSVSVAIAQVAMPDASSMAGVPLPSGDLPDAAVSVRVVRERMGNNVAGVEVTLHIGGATRLVKTDAQGRAQFEGIPPGTVVEASATVDGEALRSQAFSIPGKGGVRVALVAGIADAAARDKAAADVAAKGPARPGIVEIGGESRIIFEFQEDVLTVFYLLEIVNNARTPIDTGGPLQIELPTGVAGASVMQGSSPNVIVRADLITITGPFPPGKTMAQVGFTLPQAGHTLTLQQQWPAAMAQVFVGVEKIGDMQVSSPQIKEFRPVPMESGDTFLMGQGGRLNAGEPLVLNLSGMPAHSNTPRNAVLALVVIIFAVGAWMSFTPASASVHDQGLRARREKLLAEVVALERKRRDKALSAAESSKLQRATQELERITAELDRTGEAA